ncbi:MAG: hypothetical protein MUO30_13800 [Anaerolineales bacterium]|nr:hypothetical protein [Anaerolineales bacterium]
MNKIVTRQNILDTLHEFARQHPNTETYDGWLQKETYKYAVRYDGRVYPPKHILSMATGIPTSEFNGGEQTNRVFRQLDFDVENKGDFLDSDFLDSKRRRTMPDARLTAITNALLKYGKTVSSEVLFPTVIPEAAEIITNDPYAFCIATCLDRGTRAEVIWTIPYDIQKDLGHLNPKDIYPMTLEQLEALFKRLPRRPRYVNDAPKTIQELTRFVVEECDGDASLIWKGKKATQVHRTFDSIHGVGPGIASMAVLLIEKAFPVRFEDRENMDIKPDVHTVRVLYRLGVSAAMTPESALEATRRMNPEFPGTVDAALWDIGRNWCSPTDPKSIECPVSVVCAKRF